MRQNIFNKVRAAIGPVQFSWGLVRDFTFILLGSIVQALSLRLFLVPAQLVSGGVSGAAQVINYFTQWPIGLMVLVGNLPLFVLGWRNLGGRRFAFRTAFAVLIFSVLTDSLAAYLPNAITQDMVLNAIYGGVTMGIGLGLVYRGQGTSGGSDILGRILNQRLGISVFPGLFTDRHTGRAGGWAGFQC
jgi:uncharacterized membrane-anchored protein YitT (DUF2179 family)